MNINKNLHKHEINLSATDLLKKVVQDRNWHQGKIEHRLAAMTKTNLSRGKISYEKACEILILLGWQKVKNETWEQEK